MIALRGWRYRVVTNGRAFRVQYKKGIFSLWSLCWTDLNGHTFQFDTCELAEAFIAARTQDDNEDSWKPVKNPRAGAGGF
jgi:hypothetical protein